MLSFRQSRGRILFDFLCVLVIVASCVGAWMQTGATALIGAAGAAGLYGLVRLFDMRWPESVEATEPQRIDFAPDTRDDSVAGLDRYEPPVVTPQYSATDAIEEVEPAETIASIEPVEPVEPVEQTAPQAKPGRKAKTPRKGGGQRASTAKGVDVTELAQPADADVIEFTPTEEAEVAALPDPDDVTHSHIEPLFEPERFGRMPRRAFGRRGQI